jgi:hypothetical protein
LTRQRLVSLDLIFELRSAVFLIHGTHTPSSLIRRWGGRNVRF